MPIFEYVCKECDHQFEALVYGNEKAECPKCHSKKLAPQLSVFAVQRRALPGAPSEEHAAVAATRAVRAHARCGLGRVKVSPNRV